MTYRHPTLLALLAVACASFGDTACSSTFEPKTCSTDADCGGTLACVPQNGKSVCVAASSAPIKIGQSAAASGPSQDLGLEMKRGIQLAFDAQNVTGGIRGRQLVLDFLDDQYIPDMAEANARVLVDALAGPAPPRCPTTTTPPAPGNPFSTTELLPGPKAVLAVIGSVGTPTMVRSAPVIVETGTLYFGAFTGATAMLRDDKSGPCKKYIFNVRASYAQEARATLEYFFANQVPDDTHLISFDQNDTFGDAGYNGLVAAYTAIKGVAPKISRYRYTRDDATSVPAQATAVINSLRTLLQSQSGAHHVGILMTDTYGPGADFIKAVKDWQYSVDAEQTTLDKANRLTIIFSNVSFVGANSLSARLLEDPRTVNTPSGPKPYTDGVFVSQVVPNYQTDNSDAVLDYRRLITPTGAPPTYTSFEGYVAGRIFIEGLKNNPGMFNSDNLVNAFEGLAQLNIGLGGFVGFSPQSHQASNSVWGTSINADGTFADRYFWTDGSAIQLAE